MKPSEILNGRTYRNAGKGTTERLVRSIRTDARGRQYVYWRYTTESPFEFHESTLAAFARWAGGEVAKESVDK